MALAGKLTKAGVETALRESVDRPKVISDGDGLYLRLRPGGTASWFFAKAVNGRRREMGLGSVGNVPVAIAREHAAKARLAIAEGRDPFAERAGAKGQAEEAKSIPTFGQFAEDYIASVESGWRNEKHRAQWRSTLKTYAAPISKLRVDEIATHDVLKVLRPIWTDKPETASRVRGRIEKILSAAKAQGYRPVDSFNPATLRGHLDILLPRQPREKRGHHAALPFAQAPAFMARLRQRPALSARALEFAILTAARTSEVLFAAWGEVDLDAAVWTVPASRMKAKVEHQVPLSDAAVRLLKALRPEKVKPGDLIFSANGKPLSNMTMASLLRRMDVPVTVHGFRSTFRDWAGDAANFPRELAEAALAHTIQNKAERAYRRGTALAKRRKLMEAWSAFLAAG